MGWPRPFDNGRGPLFFSLKSGFPNKIGATMERIKFTVDSVILGNRVHAAGDVIEVDDEQFARLVKNEKAATATDDEPTQFPAPAETAAVEIPDSPDGGQGGAAKGVAMAGNRR